MTLFLDLINSSFLSDLPPHGVVAEIITKERQIQLSSSISYQDDRFTKSIGKITRIDPYSILLVITASEYLPSLTRKIAWIAFKPLSFVIPIFNPFNVFKLLAKIEAVAFIIHLVFKELKIKNELSKENLFYRMNISEWNILNLLATNINESIQIFFETLSVFFLQDLSSFDKLCFRSPYLFPVLKMRNGVTQKEEYYVDTNKLEFLKKFGIHSNLCEKKLLEIAEHVLNNSFVFLEYEIKKTEIVIEERGLLYDTKNHFLICN